jgi:hypothetical protein
MKTQFSLALYPDLTPEYITHNLIPFLNEHRDSIFDIYFTARILPFDQDAMGTIFSDEDTETLYISDLKTGVSKASFEQLYAYAALFCLEYGCKPDKTTFILRIYQGVGYEEEYLQGKKDVAHIKSLMKTIVKLDKAVSGVIKELQDVADGFI